MHTESESHERTAIETTYTVANADGSPRLRTESPHVAESFSRVGCRVTAVTGGGA